MPSPCLPTAAQHARTSPADPCRLWKALLPPQAAAAPATISHRSQAMSHGVRHDPSAKPAEPWSRMGQRGRQKHHILQHASQQKVHGARSKRSTVHSSSKRSTVHSSTHLLTQLLCILLQDQRPAVLIRHSKGNGLHACRGHAGGEAQVRAGTLCFGAWESTRTHWVETVLMTPLAFFFFP